MIPFLHSILSDVSYSILFYSIILCDFVSNKQTNERGGCDWSCPIYTNQQWQKQLLLPTTTEVILAEWYRLRFFCRVVSYCVVGVSSVDSQMSFSVQGVGVIQIFNQQATHDRAHQKRQILSPTVSVVTVPVVTVTDYTVLVEAGSISS